MTDRDLMDMALEARKHAYAPYSGFRVGAALLAEDGRVFTGCNIENAAYSPTNCAERTALFKAVSEGVTDFVKIAVAGGEGDRPSDLPTYPCGVCRQVLQEFCTVSFSIVLCSGERLIACTLGELLPHSFSKRHLEENPCSSAED